MPYTVQLLQYGPNRMATKFRHNQQTGEILTLDEVAVLEYVMHLEQERDRLAKENDEMKKDVRNVGRITEDLLALYRTQPERPKPAEPAGKPEGRHGGTKGKADNPG